MSESTLLNPNIEQGVTEPRHLKPYAPRPGESPRISDPPNIAVRALRAVLATAWNARALVTGLFAVYVLVSGQKLIASQGVVAAIPWYMLGLAVVFVGWMGTYRNRSLLRTGTRPQVQSTLPVRTHSTTAPAVPAARERPRSYVVFTALRYLLAFAALALNLYSTTRLRVDYSSAAGMWGWVASLALLLVAFIGYRPRTMFDADTITPDREVSTDIRIPRRLEVLLVALIFALAFGLRLYRLDDWAMGMHGDEGNFGLSGLAILQGQRPSPFVLGWLGHPNFSFWVIALTMKVFGTGILGLKMFMVIAGSLAIIPFYVLVRIMFGVRAALTGSVLFAVLEVALHFSRSGLINYTTPVCLVAGFCFLLLGLRTTRVLYFVLAGYFFTFNVYFYFSGRLTPLIAVAVLVYLFLLMPLVRLPGTYRRFSAFASGSPREAFAKALKERFRGVTYYSGHLVAFALACITIGSPYIAYTLDHSADMDARIQDKSVFNNEDRMTARYKVAHEPLYIGLRQPLSTDDVPFSPLVFEHTPQAVKVVDDGYWPIAFWKQTAVTLSMLTYRSDAGAFWDYPGHPATLPLDSALIIIGIVYAAWRWKDTGMAVLSAWFWATVIAGGVLTIDQPWYARLLGAIPVFAILAAVVVNKLAAEFIGVVSRLRPGSKRLRRTAQALAGLGVLGFLIYTGVQNVKDYYVIYPATGPYRIPLGVAVFVRDMTSRMTSDGGAAPIYYNLNNLDRNEVGWRYEVNRFLNYGAEGSDLPNVAEVLPLRNGLDRDAVFIVWPSREDELATIKSVYPEGLQEVFLYGPNTNPLFKYYLVSAEELRAAAKQAQPAQPTGPQTDR